MPHALRPHTVVCVDVTEIAGQAHLPWAEVHLDAIDAAVFAEASRRARALGKDGLEVWTHDDSTAALRFLDAHGYREARRYLLQHLDVAASADPGEPAFQLVTYAERPDLAHALYEVALQAYPDQPTRADSSIGDFVHWRGFGLDPHRPDAYFMALEDGRVLGYAYLEVDGAEATHGFAAVARAARGRGVATALKQAQIRWAKEHGLRTLKTANELRVPAIRRLNERFGYRVVRTEVVLRGPLATTL